MESLWSLRQNLLRQTPTLTAAKGYLLPGDKAFQDPQLGRNATTEVLHDKMPYGSKGLWPNHELPPSLFCTLAHLKGNVIKRRLKYCHCSQVSLRW